MECHCTNPNFIAWKAQQHPAHDGQLGSHGNFMAYSLSSNVKAQWQSKCYFSKGCKELLQNPNGLCRESPVEACSRLQTTSLSAMDTMSTIHRLAHAAQVAEQLI